VMILWLLGRTRTDNPSVQPSGLVSTVTICCYKLLSVSYLLDSSGPFYYRTACFATGLKE